MNNNKQQFRKAITWTSLAYGAFTALSILGPIILDRIWNRPRDESGLKKTVGTDYRAP